MKTLKYYSALAYTGLLLLGLTTLSQAQSNCISSPPGLVGFWPGDGNALDVQGGNDGTLLNGATFAAGMVDDAFSFNGVNGCIDLNTKNLIGSSSYSISTWFKTGVGGNILSNVHSGGPISYTLLRVRGDNGKLHFVMRGVGLPQQNWMTTARFDDNQWHHAVAAVDRNTAVRIYVDGSEITNFDNVGTVQVGSVDNSSDTYHIGSNGECNGVFNGDIDELSIYNRALSVSEIQNIYNAGSGGKCKISEIHSISLASGFGARILVSGPPFDNTTDLAASSDGKLYVGDYGNPILTLKAKIHEIDLSTLAVSTLVNGLPISQPGQLIIGNGHPVVGTDLIVSDHNTVETGFCCDGRVFRINRTTGGITVLAKGNPEFPIPGDPFGLAFGPGGDFGFHLYVMDFMGASVNPPVLYRIDENTGAATTFLVNSSIWTVNRSPAIIAFGSGGGFGNDLYVSDGSSVGGPRKIWRVTPQGNISIFVEGLAGPLEFGT